MSAKKARANRQQHEPQTLPKCWAGCGRDAEMISMWIDLENGTDSGVLLCRPCYERRRNIHQRYDIYGEEPSDADKAFLEHIADNMRSDGPIK